MELRQISKSKKGLSIGEAPMIIMIIGFVFMLMVTIAYVAEKFQDGLGTSAATVANETLSSVDNSTGVQVGSATQCNFQDFAVTAAINASNGAAIDSGNYTTTTAGVVIADGYTEGYTDEDWNVTYTYAYSGIVCNLTTDLQTELSDNSSMAGMLLTISFIGIILGVLIAVFAIGGKKKM